MNGIEDRQDALDRGTGVAGELAMAGGWLAAAVVVAVTAQNHWLGTWAQARAGLTQGIWIALHRPLLILPFFLTAAKLGAAKFAGTAEASPAVAGGLGAGRSCGRHAAGRRSARARVVRSIDIALRRASRRRRLQAKPASGESDRGKAKAVLAGLMVLLLPFSL